MSSDERFWWMQTSSGENVAAYAQQQHPAQDTVCQPCAWNKNNTWIEASAPLMYRAPWQPGTIDVHWMTISCASMLSDPRRYTASKGKVHRRLEPLRFRLHMHMQALGQLNNGHLAHVKFTVWKCNGHFRIQELAVLLALRLRLQLHYNYDYDYVYDYKYDYLHKHTNKQAHNDIYIYIYICDPGLLAPHPPKASLGPLSPLRGYGPPPPSVMWFCDVVLGLFKFPGIFIVSVARTPHWPQIIQIAIFRFPNDHTIW